MYQSFKQDGYILPNDAEEQDRLDLQHAVNLALLDGRLATAPVQNPARAVSSIFVRFPSPIPCMRLPRLVPVTFCVFRSG